MYAHNSFIHIKQLYSALSG